MYRTRILRDVHGGPRRAHIYRDKIKVGKVEFVREAVVFIPARGRYVTKIQYETDFSLPEMKYIHSQKMKNKIVRLIEWDGGKERKIKIKLLPFEGFYHAKPKKPLQRFLKRPGKKGRMEIPETVGVLVQKKISGKHFDPAGPEAFWISDKFNITDIHVENLIKKKDTVYIVDFLPKKQYKKKVKEKLPEDYRMGFLRKLIKKRG